MRSRTWFFNAAVLRKDITRFAPVWGVYSALLLLLQLASMPVSEAWSNASGTLAGLNPWSYGNLLYGAICASQLMGDLFKPQLCNTLHTMPLRREGWFITHITAGLLFSIVPNTIAALLMLPFLGKFTVVAAVWLAVMTLQFVAFFGMAVFAAMCAGNCLGMAAVLTLLNLIAPLAHWVITELVEPLVYGVKVDDALLSMFSPATHLLGLEYIEKTINYPNQFLKLGNVVPEDWLYLGILAILGVALLGVSLLMYRKRKLETAGDFLAVKLVKPIFLAMYTLSIAALFSGLPGGGLLGLLIGYFTGLMLLQRTVRIFKWKHIRNGLIGAGVLAISFVLILWDPLGVTTYVPERSDVSQMYVYYADKEGSDIANYAIENVNIWEYIGYHKQALEEKDQLESGDTAQIVFHYVLKNGIQVKRYYDIHTGSAIMPTLKHHLSNYRVVLDTEKTFKEFEKQIVTAGFDAFAENAYSFRQVNLLYAEQKTQLLYAIKADCEAGTLAQHFAFHADSIGMLWLQDTDGRLYYIYIYSDSANVIAFLETLD